MSRNSALQETLPRELAEAAFSRLYRDHEREILCYALRRSDGPGGRGGCGGGDFSSSPGVASATRRRDEARLWLHATARRVLQTTDGASSGARAIRGGGVPVALRSAYCSVKQKRHDLPLLFIVKHFLAGHGQDPPPPDPPLPDGLDC